MTGNQAQHAASLVRVYWEEARHCWDAGAGHGFVVFTASALEAALLALCLEHEAEIRSQAGDWDEREVTRWVLKTLVDAALAMGWLPNRDASAGEMDLAGFVDTLRGVRNWVHPGISVREARETTPSVVPGLMAAMGGTFLGAMEELHPLLKDAGLRLTPPPEHLGCPPFRIRRQSWERDPT